MSTTKSIARQVTQFLRKTQPLASAGIEFLVTLNNGYPCRVRIVSTQKFCNDLIKFIRFDLIYEKTLSYKIKKLVHFFSRSTLELNLLV